MVTGERFDPRRLLGRVLLEPPRMALTLGRAGLVDPLLGAAYARGVARWGTSLAAAYAAASLRHPNRAALIDEEGLLSFTELDQWTDSLAGGLAAQATGAVTIGVLCRNHRGFVATAVAAAKLGADSVYLNTGFAAPQLAEVLRRECVTHLVHDTEFADIVTAAGALGSASPTATWVTIVADGDPDDGASLAGLVALRRRAPRRPGQVGLPVLLTSGTTGTPKGARRGRPTFDVAGATGLLSAVPYRTSDVFVVPAPLFHAWGLSQMVVAASLGATLVTTRRFDPDDVLSAVERHRGTVLAVVPVMLQRILQSAEQSRFDTSSLRIVAASGSALTGSLATAWMDRFGDHLYNLYGSTEVGQATIAGPLDLRANPGSAGRVLPGARVEILDDHDGAVPAGRTGRIFVGSPHRFSGYTGGGGKAEVDGLLETGDVGYFDSDGRLFVTGRYDDMIVSGGENVFPREIEDLLADHPAVADVAVVGVDDADLGQRLRAVIVLRRGARLTAAQVQDHVRANLARHKVPRDVVFATEIPRNAAGKIVRRDLD